jgi:hypothetical protein
MTPGARSARGGVRASSEDALRLTVDYVKQETLGPVRQAGRFLAVGLGGALLLSVGVLLLLVGLLRLLQTETGGTFTGNLSWVPYLIVLLVGLGIAAVAVWRIVSGPARRQVSDSNSLTGGGGPA